MRSGRHGAARPPIGVLIHRDRVDFSLFALIIVIALAVMVLTGWTSIAFWLGLVPIFATLALIVRRIDRLARDEVRDEELL
ncbi:hypothetical protein CDO52_07790 [Nocardiopsis gilva YIM 90087]|uniref:Uncharacterized protein n=1 Tax=Nocardiopsis gilva YIM 90087 TaxID=1235441 RepID=A0A223S3J8_9ACTN|nr:hypothetical protein [Nocardiopsis gilva]ASU82700.1 hypothetical protein CDO52_07790 [Nocardiopsis gilva YIM 90087]